MMVIFDGKMLKVVLNKLTHSSVEQIKKIVYECCSVVLLGWPDSGGCDAGVAERGEATLWCCSHVPRTRKKPQHV